MIDRDIKIYIHPSKIQSYVILLVIYMYDVSWMRNYSSFFKDILCK